MGLGGLGRLGRLGRPAPSKGGGNIITSIFADGTDGFYFDFSKIDRLFQTTTGGSAADDAGENIALGLESHGWGGKTLAQMSAAQPQIWQHANVTVVGEAQIIGPQVYRVLSTAGVNSVVRISGALTVGRRYEVTFTIDSIAVLGAGVRVGDSGAVFTTTGTKTSYFLADDTTAFIKRNSGATDIQISNVSFKEIPGNHGLQATAAAQPKWQTGGLARFDGSDDNLLTTLNPAASFSMLYKGKVTSASKIVMGSRAATDTRAFIGTDASGLLAGGVGTDSITTIKGGADIRATTGVGALVYSASGVVLYWNGAVLYSGALNGTPNTTIPLRVGAFNDNGTGGSFADADIYHALAIKKALTAAQIAAITNLWGTT